MSKILKFPNLNSPASKEELEKLFNLQKKMEKKEEESSKATIQFLIKLKSISNHLGSLKKMDINNMIRDYKKYFNGRLNEMRKALEK